MTGLWRAITETVIVIGTGLGVAFLLKSELGMTPDDSIFTGALAAYAAWRIFERALKTTSPSTELDSGDFDD